MEANWKPSNRAGARGLLWMGRARAPRTIVGQCSSRSHYHKFGHDQFLEAIGLCSGALPLCRGRAQRPRGVGLASCSRALVCCSPLSSTWRHPLAIESSLPPIRLAVAWIASIMIRPFRSMCPFKVRGLHQELARSHTCSSRRHCQSAPGRGTRGARWLPLGPTWGSRRRGRTL